MPDTYVENATWDTPVQGPANTELADAETSVTLPAQALTNRTGYLYAIIRPATGTGVTRVRTLASTAAMKALNNNTDNDLVMIEGGAAGSSLYRFVAEAAVGADVIGQVYASTGTGTAGNWKAVYYDRLDAALGLATLDASQRLVRLPKPGLVADSQAIDDPATTCTTATTWYDAGALTLPFTALTGDILRAEVDLFFLSTGTGNVTMRLAIVNTDGSVNVGIFSSSDTGLVPVTTKSRTHLALSLAAVGNGTMTAKVQAMGDTNGNQAGVYFGVLRARQIRP